MRITQQHQQARSPSFIACIYQAGSCTFFFSHANINIFETSNTLCLSFTWMNMRPRCYVCPPHHTLKYMIYNIHSYLDAYISLSSNFLISPIITDASPLNSPCVSLSYHYMIGMLRVVDMMRGCWGGEAVRRWGGEEVRRWGGDEDVRMRGGEEVRRWGCEEVSWWK